MFTAFINVPGYLPTDDEPPTFETAREAWEYLADERERAEDEAGEADTSLSVTYEELIVRSSYQAPAGEGTVHGPTPGYDGAHDLGVAYSVTASNL